MCRILKRYKQTNRPNKNRLRREYRINKKIN